MTAKFHWFNAGDRIALCEVAVACVVVALIIGGIVLFAETRA